MGYAIDGMDKLSRSEIAMRDDVPKVEEQQNIEVVEDQSIQATN